MGRVHAETGLLAALGTATYIHADVPTLIMLCTTLPGAAILSDIDHPDSTVSRTYGPITGVLSKVLHHRRQTHSIPGILVFGTAIQYASMCPNNMIAKAFLFVVLVLIWASTIRLFKIGGWLDDFAPIPFAAAVTFFAPYTSMIGIVYPFKILAPIVVIGMLVHVVGDVVTYQPIPLWWPLSKRGTSLKLFKAGSWFESWVIQISVIFGSAYVGWLWIKGFAMIEWSFWIF